MFSFNPYIKQLIKQYEALKQAASVRDVKTFCQIASSFSGVEKTKKGILIRFSNRFDYTVAFTSDDMMDFLHAKNLLTGRDKEAWNNALDNGNERELNNAAENIYNAHRQEVNSYFIFDARNRIIQTFEEEISKLKSGYYDNDGYDNDEIVEEDDYYYGGGGDEIIDDYDSGFFFY